MPPRPWCQCLLYLPSHFKHLSQQGAVFKGRRPVHSHRLCRRSFLLQTSTQLCPHFPQLHYWFERRRHLRRVDTVEAKSTTTKSNKTGEMWAPFSTLNTESRVRLTIVQPFQAFRNYSRRRKGVKLKMSDNHAAAEDEHELFQDMQIGHKITLN